MSHLKPGRPSDNPDPNEPEDCEYCGCEVYETGADTRFIGSTRLFCDDDCRRMWVEERWGEAIENDERLPEDVEEYIKTEMVA